MIATSPGLPSTSSESSFLPGSYESIRMDGGMTRKVRAVGAEPIALDQPPAFVWRRIAGSS